MTDAVDLIRERVPDAAPAVAMVLGSGLGAIADGLADATAIPYAELPGFPRPTVRGHAGALVLGHLAGVPVALMQGRAHIYETGRGDAMAAPIAALADLGCKVLLLTCAAGSLRRDAGPGSVVLINDHIALGLPNPLTGRDGDGRFVDLVDAYDPDLRRVMASSAATLNMPLPEGVYMWFSGPSFETPAEIRAAGKLGADLVGMSIVPEVILARHAGMRVLALATVTNLAAGLEPGPIDHEGSLTHAGAAAERLGKLLTVFVDKLDSQSTF